MKSSVLSGQWRAKAGLTEARIEQEPRPNNLDWITALRAPAIRALMEEGTIQPSLFD